MKKGLLLFLISIAVISLLSFINNDSGKTSLRELYSQPVGQWPMPVVDSGVRWTELGVLPPSPVENRKEELKHKIELGKILFFDPRLSSSDKVSCATCHQPELHWTDGKEKSEGHEGAKLALEVMTYRLAKYVASMAVATGGIDALVFTGGIGENSELVRRKTVEYLGFLGLEIDQEANLATRFGAAGIISPAGKAAAVLVVPTNEELMIAHDTSRLSGINP